MDTGAVKKNVPHIIAAVILIFILLFVLARFGYIRPGDIPGFCGIYQSVVGTPRFAIVAGEDGMGDPEKLQALLAERTGKFADLVPLNLLTAGGVLDNYQIVIVDKARTIDSATLKAFSNYVSRGGKLVWIGDAGTGLGDKDKTCAQVAFAYRPAQYGVNPSACQLLGDPQKISSCTLGDCSGMSNTCPRTQGCQTKSECEAGCAGSGQCLVGCVLKPESCTEQCTTDKSKCESAQGSETCGDWVTEEPSVPEGAPGICAKSFGAIVEEYVDQNKSIQDRVRAAGLVFCKASPNIESQGAENIEACIAFAKAKLGNEAELEASDFDATCTFGNRTSTGIEYKHAVNYWSRGPSQQETGAFSPAINFGNEVLGVDFVGSLEAGLRLRPIDVGHPLIRGYAGVITIPGEFNVAIVSADNYRLRTRVLMNIEDPVGGKVYPAVLISNPRGPLIGGVGLVVYYAFPPEQGITQAGGHFQGPGTNLIDNLVDFTTCR